MVAVRAKDSRKADPQYLAIKCISKARLLGLDRRQHHGDTHDQDGRRTRSSIIEADKNTSMV